MLQGTKSYLLQDDNGNILGTHSVSAGLDYAAVGPEHAFLKDVGRVEYTYARDEEALAAFELLSKTEGIIPALESSHAIAEAVFERIDVLGATDFTFTLTATEGSLDLDVTVPPGHEDVLAGLARPEPA